MELCKSIVATQRDHGNRDVRPNARMKYLVHEKGIDEFRKMVETYFGIPIAPWREIQPWKYEDWIGWHEWGDDKLFLGINIEQGRIKDIENVRVKSALHRIETDYNLTMVLTPSQSIIFRDILPSMKDSLYAIFQEYGIL